MKRNNLRGFLTGILTMTLILGLALPAGAALSKESIEVYSGVSIYVDGVEMKPTDANGKPVKTFVYDGTTYVPLRAVSQSLGKNVNWDGENQRVYIGETPGMKQYLLNVCPPYQTERYETPTTISMAGQKYTNCIILGRTFELPHWNSGGYALFNLNGAYDTLSFDIGHRDGADMADSTLNLYLDGELSFSMDLKSEMMPQRISLPLHRALQMKLEMSRDGACYGFGNIEIY